MALRNPPTAPLIASAVPPFRRPTVELFRPDSWRSEVAAAVREAVPPRAIGYLKSYPGDDMFADSMDYMAQAYEHAGDYFSPDSRKKLMEVVAKRFSHLRGFHACRPCSLESYYRDGLIVLTRERLARIAYDVFERTIPLAEFRRRALAADLQARLGNVYFSAEAEELVSMCGHYLIRGSESLGLLFLGNDVRSLRQLLECEERISSHGIPTIFECDIPIRYLPVVYQQELAGTLITHYLQLESRRPVLANDWSRNWGFSISRNLPARYIRGHFHPTMIPDPRHLMTPYRNPHTRCPWCATASGPHG